MRSVLYPLVCMIALAGVTAGCEAFDPAARFEVSEAPHPAVAEPQPKKPAKKVVRKAAAKPAPAPATAAEPLAKELPAEAAAPAAAPVVAAAPPPPPAIVGMSERQIVTLFGGPASETMASPSKIWRWGGEDCRLEIHLFPNMERGGFSALDYSASGQDCVQRLRRDTQAS